MNHIIGAFCLHASSLTLFLQFGTLGCSLKSSIVSKENHIVFPDFGYRQSLSTLYTEEATEQF